MNEFSRKASEEPELGEFPEITIGYGESDNDEAAPPRIEVSEPSPTPDEGFTDLTAESNSTEHPEVVRYRQEKEVCSVQLPDYKIDGDFTIRNRLIHYDLDGKVVEGESPYEGVDDFARDGVRQLNEQKTQTRRALLDAPDINDQHREILEEVSESNSGNFPVKILSAATYDEICATRPDLEDNRDAPAFRGFDLTIVKELDSETKELYGDQILRFLLHHEANHANAKSEDSAWYTVPSITPEGGTVSHKSSGDPFGGFTSTEISNFKPLEFQNRGELFEEGYAELSALMAVNDFTEIDESAPPLIGVRPDGKFGRVKNNETSDYSYLIPKEFAQAISDDGKVFSAGAHYTSAAYALYQLDKKSDGELLSNLELAREDPKAFDNVITTLEEIRPGLFRELYNLPKDEFYKSLWLIDPERPQ